MSRLTRKILFWFFVVLFFLMAPLISLYAFGYYLDFDTFKIVRTGSVYVSSLPSQAQVFVDGKYRDTTPALIKRLKPGAHEVEIKTDDCFTWTKTFLVNPYQVTEARNVFLPLKNPLLKLQPDIATLDQLATPEETKSKERFIQELKNNNVPVQDVKIRGNFGYFIKDPDSIIFTKSLSNNGQSKQISLTSVPAEGQELKGAPRLILGPAQEIALLGADQKLYLLNQETRELQLLQANVQDAGFSPDETKFFILSDNEIFVYYLAPTTEQPLHVKGEKVFLVRLSTPIVSVSWYGKSNYYLLFSIANKIKMLEIDDRGNHNIFDLLPAFEAKLLSRPDDAKQYFESKGQVFSLELEP